MSEINFTLIQANLFWENKEANLQMFEKKIENIKVKTNIVVLPEMFNTGFSLKPQILAETMNGNTISWMKSIAEKGNFVLCGSLMIQENNHFYNRFVWVKQNGEIEYYDKRHLFSFGKENENFDKGNKQLITNENEFKINCLVCYDLRFPIWSRHTNTNNFDILLYVANWPKIRNVAWKSLLQARAIENQCYVIAVNRVGKDGFEIDHSGDSMIINPLGEIMYRKENLEDIFSFTINKTEIDECRNKFGFLNDADNFTIV